jgi:hypothetical protein
MGAVDGLIGLAAGAAIGGLLCSLARWAGTVPIFVATKLRMVPGHKNGTVPFSPPTGLFWALSSVGLFLGWQAAVALAAAALAVSAVNWLLRRVLRHLWQIPATVWLLTATLFGILFWVRIATLS